MNLTVLFMIVLVVAVTVFDVWIISKKGKKESISAHIIRASHKYPMLPFALGILCGHLLWSMKTADWMIP